MLIDEISDCQTDERGVSVVYFFVQEVNDRTERHERAGVSPISFGFE